MSKANQEFNLRYVCPSCNHCWEEVWDSCCDSECGKCNEKNIQPMITKETTDHWSDKQENDWEKYKASQSN